MFKRIFGLLSIIVLLLSLLVGCNLTNELQEADLRVSTDKNVNLEVQEEDLKAVEIILLNEDDKTDRYYTRKESARLELNFKFNDLTPNAKYKVLALAINHQEEVVYLASSWIVADNKTNHFVLEFSSDDFVYQPHPDVSEAIPSQESIWPPNKKFVEIELKNVLDPAGGTADIEILKITSDEPIGIEDGKPAAYGLGADTAKLKTNRLGEGSGRVYEITFLATSQYGTKTVSRVQVCVPHDMSGRGAVNEGQKYDATQVSF